VLLMNIGPVYRLFWPIGQRAINVSEAPVPAVITGWHTYVIVWQHKTARFEVDGEIVLACETAPGGPLGFVMWLDNQYMVVTPWGRFKYGLLAAPGRQWMEVSQLEISNE
jgi:beta-glucanase (GH16 family)